MGLLVEKVVTDSGNLGLNLYFLLHCCHGICLQRSQADATSPTSRLVRPLADHEGHSAEGVGHACEVVRAGHERWSVGGGHQEDATIACCGLDPGNQRLLAPSPLT